MPRRRRRIKSGTVYELSFRARASLPFVAYQVIELIIGSSLARAQRDDKVTLCHDIWNGSHTHTFLVAHDAEQCIRFHSEVKKKITDSLKRLLGLEYLHIWEDNASPIEIGDLDAAIDRIAYIYANPAQDNLEESIEDFPGYSSWKAFKQVENSLNAEHTEQFPWLRLPSIPKLSKRILTPDEDRRLVRHLKERNTEWHRLIRKPNAWMKAFGVASDAEVEEINQRVIENLRNRENVSRELRKKNGRRVMGRKLLCSQPIMKPHRPKKKERKIFIITTINELRLASIAEFKEFCSVCRQCYLRYRAGDFSISWPPGAFRPPIPPTVNILPGI